MRAEAVLSAEPVAVEVRDGVLAVTLNRPRAGNALSSSLVTALDSALEHTSSSEVRCVLVRGAGKHFCVGGDVSELGADTSAVSEERSRGMVMRTEGVLRRLQDLDVPVVVLVHGAVAGAGLALMLVADLVVAARSARFVPAYGALGLTPDVGVSFLLPRVVGERRALQFLLSGRDLASETACQWGLVTEVVDDDTALARTEELARRLAGSVQARETKRLVRSGFTVGRDASAVDEAETFARALATDTAQRRIAAFRAKH
jgi:2-(1,2-epoxy-1,2-dihydrophenyl)acetyl-CoA isomerase